MFDKKLVNRFLIFSTVGIIGGSAFAKLNNKNILKGALLGLIVGIGSNYVLFKSQNLINDDKRKKEADLTKNMTSEQKNQYTVSQGGKIKISL
jgi:uncharacterized membrane protein YfcA